MALDSVVDFLFASANKATSRQDLGLESAAGVFQNAPGKDQVFNPDSGSIAEEDFFVKLGSAPPR
jgi:hypothetical protein